MEITTQQRELILEGLRYVRSSRKLAFRDLPEKPNPERDQDLQLIASLMERLHGSVSGTTS